MIYNYDPNNKKYYEPENIELSNNRCDSKKHYLGDGYEIIVNEAYFLHKINEFICFVKCNHCGIIFRTVSRWLTSSWTNFAIIFTDKVVE